MKRPGILLVLNSLETGGAEIFAMRLARFLCKDFRVFVVTVFEEQNDPQFTSYFLKESGAVHLPFYSGPSAFTDWLFWKINALGYHLKSYGLHRKLLAYHQQRYWSKVIRTNGIELCNSHLFASELFVLRHLLLSCPYLKWVVTIHSSYNQEAYSEFSKEVKEQFFQDVRTIFTSADHAFCVAEHNKSLLKELKIDIDPETVYLGYQPPTDYDDVRSEYGIPKNAFLIAMVARGCREKGWMEALAAFRLLRKKHNHTWLVLTCPETEHINELKTINQDQEGVVFTGYVSNPSSIMRSADCVVLPTHFPESLPYSIIEAFGAGRPVIATPIAEIPQMLQTPEGLAGHLLPFTSQGVADHEKLAELLELWVADPSELEAAKSRSQLAFMKFSMEHCGGRYRHVFKELLYEKK